MGKLTTDHKQHTSLNLSYPKIAAEYDARKTGTPLEELNANSRSAQKLSWQCTQKHSWQATMGDRVERNNQCPYCTGKLATPENNLAVIRPDLAPMFNTGANGTTPDQITPTLNRKVHWTCPQGHHFLKSPKEVIRTNGYCWECKSLAYNYPELRKYYHTQNILSFDELLAGANKKVLWACEKGHEYEQSVKHKALHNHGCPYCSGRYATPENNLLAAHPEIAKEFDAEKSGTTADKVTPKSNKKMWWKCSKGHSYQASPSKKTLENNSYGCAVCSGYQIDDTNSFGTLFPELAAEFQTEANGISPFEFPAGRSKKYEWKCSAKGHIFYASVADRTRRGDGCPYCSGRYATPENNLAVIKPMEAKHFHPTKNSPLTAYDFTPSSNKKVHWICEDGHEWVTTVNAKMGCSQCSLSATSKIENLLRESIVASGIMDTVEPEVMKLKLKWRKNSTMTIDIMATLLDRKFVIEYDGYYFHSGIHNGTKSEAHAKDMDKTQALLDAGYHVIRIREDNYAGKLAFLDIEHPHLLQLHHKYSNRIKADTFDRVIDEIRTWISVLPD